jgi:flagellar basal-body rod protein FlgB
MTSSGLLGLISQSNAMLTQRQAAIAQNIANVNTPGYQSVDVASDAQDFSRALDAAGTALAKTHRNHLDIGAAGAALVERQTIEGSETNHSGNSVSLEKEMLKAGEVASRFALGTQLYKSFHKMTTMSAR